MIFELVVQKSKFRFTSKFCLGYDIVIITAQLRACKPENYIYPSHHDYKSTLAVICFYTFEYFILCIQHIFIEPVRGLCQQIIFLLRGLDMTEILFRCLLGR